MTEATVDTAMRVSALRFAALTSGVCLALAGCGGSQEPRTPLPAPEVELTQEEKQVWAPLPPDRSAIPVLLYHGIGPESDFSNDADASYGIHRDDFAEQMTMIAHAGYETIDLETFVRFVQGASVDLPPRPLLLTFDDARADSWTGADAVLREARLRRGHVRGCRAGRGRRRRVPDLGGTRDSRRAAAAGSCSSTPARVTSRSGTARVPTTIGPYYAYEEQDENFDEWRERVRSDIDWGRETLADHIPEYEPLAFAPPYGSYGQDGTNNP